MLDYRRPQSIPPSDAQGGILIELAMVGGALAVLYFAAYLYELGFLWRLGLPLGLAEIGFSRILAIVALAVPAGCMLVATLLPLRAPSAGASVMGDSVALAAVTLGTLGVCVIAIGAGAPTRYFFDVALVHYAESAPGWFGSVVFLAGILCIALYLNQSMVLLATPDAGRVLLSGIVLVLLFALPFALGWRGGGQKESRPATFLYLADSDDLALVRLYPDKAVFLRYDRANGKFASSYKVRHFENGDDTLMARQLVMR